MEDHCTDITHISPIIIQRQWGDYNYTVNEDPPTYTSVSLVEQLNQDKRDRGRVCLGSNRLPTLMLGSTWQCAGSTLSTPVTVYQHIPQTQSLDLQMTDQSDWKDTTQQMYFSTPEPSPN